MRASIQQRRGRYAALAVFVAVLMIAIPAWAGVTWSPTETGTPMDAILDRAGATNPTTCDTTTPSPPVVQCTDSAATYNEPSRNLAVSNDGATHYLHAVYLTDIPSGDAETGRKVAYGPSLVPTCETAVDPVYGAGGYCSGVYYTRSSDGGATWGGGGLGTGGSTNTPLRVGPRNINVARQAIAAEGQYVYVAYVTTLAYWTSMCANAPRVLYVRVNTNYGDPASWLAPVRLTSLTGRMDYPSISASGSSVWVTHTDSLTGDIVLDRSTDNGVSYATQTIGNSRNTFDNHESPGSGCGAYGVPTPAGLEGYDGAPTIAGDGSLVAASWIRDTSGKLVAKISTDGGATWPGGGGGLACTGGPVCTQGLTPGGAIGPVSGNPPSNRGSQSVDVLGTRAVFAWKDNIDNGDGRPKGVFVKEFSSVGGWGVTKWVSCLQSTAPCGSLPPIGPGGVRYNDAFATSVALFGTGGTGVTWAACPFTPTNPTLPCDNDRTGADADPGAEILFKETWNNGTYWWAGVNGSYQRIADNTDATHKVNEFPTLLYDKPGASTVGCADGTSGPEVGCDRYILFTSRNRQFTGTNYKLYLSKGTQT